PILPWAGLRLLGDIALGLVQLRRLSRSVRAIVAYQTLYGGLIAVIAARWIGAASVVFIRAECEYLSYLENPIDRAASRLAWRLADRVLLQSPSLVEPFLERADRLGLRRPMLMRKLGIVPNGVDLPSLHASARADVLFVGRLHPMKGLDV